MTTQTRAADTRNVSQDLAAYAAKQEEAQEDIDVWPQNWDAVMLFNRAQTQWRVGMAGATGLDYAGVRTLMDLHSPEDPVDCFERVQVMELETLRAMDERREVTGA